MLQLIVSVPFRTICGFWAPFAANCSVLPEIVIAGSPLPSVRLLRVKGLAMSWLDALPLVFVEKTSWVDASLTGRTLPLQFVVPAVLALQLPLVVLAPVQV